jgi:hypothetical protein
MIHLTRFGEGIIINEEKDGSYMEHKKYSKIDEELRNVQRISYNSLGRLFCAKSN